LKKLLACLDGSPRERAVLQTSVLLAKKLGAQVLLFRSVGIPQELPENAYSMAVNEIPHLLERRAQEALRMLEADVPAELRGGIRVLIGTPWPSIDRIAKEANVDLIVIGSHGYQALDHILGTTAAKVVNHADRAVLVVRAPERFLGNSSA
jgi:nucleotide-binding universal stress UspA family protein